MTTRSRDLPMAEADPTVRLRLVAYVRVSTERQTEGLGPDVQRQAIKAWARRKGHRVALWTADEGVSGSNGVEGRVGLLDALSAFSEGIAHGLVVYRLDRLARDLIVQEQLLAEVKRLGGQVFSTSAAEDSYLSDDPDDPSRKLIRQVLGAVSEYERSMIALRLRSGRRRKAEKGGYAYGAPPLGHRAEGRELVPDEQEQRTVARIAELRANDLSLRNIARTLTAEGYTPKRAQVWHPNTIARILGRLDQQPNNQQKGRQRG